MEVLKKETKSLGVRACNKMSKDELISVIRTLIVFSKDDCLVY
jgi:hypothetical protein